MSLFSEIKGPKMPKLLNKHNLLVLIHVLAASIQERPQFKKKSFAANICGFYSNAASDRELILMARVR